MGEPRLALDPTDRSKRPRPADYLFRAAVVHLRAEGRDLASVAKELYRDDRVLPVVLQRAASAAATVANPPWAGLIAEQTVGDLLQAIASISAAAALLVRAQQINFDRKQSIRLPSRLTDASYAGTWLAENQPVPVFQYPVSAGVALTPHKLGCVSVYTREMLESSNIEMFVKTLLSESAALALDKCLFGAQPDDGVTPPGILNGLTPIAAANGGSRADNMADDLENLVQAIAGRGGGAEPVFVAAAAQATAMKVRVGPKFDAAILPSMALAPGTVICVEPRSLVATTGGATPEFSIADSTLVQMLDNPTADALAGSPTRSVYQIDSTALKMVLRNVDWKLRAQHCAYVQGTNW